MEIQEVSYNQLNGILDCHMKPIVIFVHTPLCGTCKLAKKMVSIAIKPYESSFITVSCNLNQMPSLAEKWKIESVPCLIFVRNNMPIKQIYSFQSVTYLYEMFQKLAGITNVNK